MNNEKLECLLEARNIYHKGLIAEDTAYSSRSNTFLTFNSILALSFVANLQYSFDKEWRYYFLYIIPFFALIINIIWNWLGCRTMLAYKFYFSLTKEVEGFLKKESLRGNDYLEYFNYAELRKTYWENNKKGMLSLVSVSGGANKIFCYRIPQVIYLFWILLFCFVLGKYTNYCIVALIGLIGLVIFIIFITFENQIKKTEDYKFISITRKD